MYATLTNSRHSQGSEEVDELKELELRAGLVTTKVSSIRMPLLRKPTQIKLTRKKTLTFSNTVTIGDGKGK